MELLSIQSKQDVRTPKQTWINSLPGLILTDASLTPIAFNYEGAAILSYPNKPNVERLDTLRIPQKILDEVSRCKLTDSFAVFIPFQAGRREYICQVFLVNYYRCESAQPTFALLLQRNSSTNETVYKMAAQFNLTGREREALQGISIGLSSKELAMRMRISPNTVKAYLRLVMVKMGVTSRAGLVAKILEQSSGAIDGLARNGVGAETVTSLRAAGHGTSRSRVRG